MVNRKNSQRWARYKNKKRLKRKYKTYNPRHTAPNNRLVLKAPENFSIINSRDKVLEYLDKIFLHISRNEFLIMDMSKIQNTDALTVSLVIAIMLDGSKDGKEFAKHVSVKIPTGNNGPAQMFRKTHFNDTVTTHNADQNFFMSRTDSRVNNLYTKQIINFAQNRGVMESTEILNPILVEMFSNTNNHASLGKEKIPWFLSIVDDGSRLCFSAIDLGIGIYESLKTNSALKNIPQKEFDVINDMYDNEQSRYLSSQIPVGVYSSTQELSRGKGLKEIYDRANSSTNCKKFVIITNKAMVNLLNITEIEGNSGVSFGGTAFYWEMEIS